MRNILLLLIGIADFFTNFPYLIDTYRRKTKPNVASWSTWTLVNGISAVSALAAGGALNSVILAGSYFIGSFAILVLAILKGTRKYTLFDGICQLVAIAGLIFWLVADNPNIAILVSIGVDILAVLPSVRHAYIFPGEETFSTFFLAGLLATGTLALATSWSLAAVAFPIDSIVVNGALAIIIFWRRRHLAIAHKH